MPSRSENFSLSEPIPRVADDWNNVDYRRMVLARLVNGVYILEDDRLQKRDETQAVAPPWWESFRFQLKHKFIDKTGSIFGAIYEYKCQDPVPTAPQYVIAFRGTILKKGTVIRDVKLNIECCLNELHESPCFQDAMDYVCNMVAGGARVWLAGHSLGSAMALLAGKNMAKMGCYLETYLFNPPFFSFPIEAVPMDERIKTVIRSVRLIGQACRGCRNRVVNGHQRHEAEVLDPFVALSNWVPYLFVNPEDPICSEYIGYFRDRKRLEKKRLFGKLDKRVTKSSMDSGSESLHRIPSADLTIHRGQLTEQLSVCEKFKSAHGIQQWLRHISYQSLRYEYNATN